MNSFLPSDSRSKFSSFDPSTKEIIKDFYVDETPQVLQVVKDAKVASLWWQEIDFHKRKKYLKSWAKLLSNRSKELAQLIQQENGKLFDDALLEVVLSVEHLGWAASHAEQILSHTKVPSGWLMFGSSSYIHYEPLGTVGVIGPWNYPLFTPMGSISYALAAGNVVVFKPSEYVPLVAQWLKNSFDEVVPNIHVLQVVNGFGETGEALCKSGVDKISFTGSEATSKKVMKACAENLTPVLIESGGKDSLLVAHDADIDEAADAAAWGAYSNGGQTCIGIETVYVVEEVYDSFIEKLSAIVKKLRSSSEVSSSYGPMTIDRQCEIVRSQVQDAIEKNAHVVFGSTTYQDNYINPILLTDVAPDAQILEQETLGPVLVIRRVKDIDEAIDLVNKSAYALSAAIFSKRHGLEIAHHIKVGMVSINSILSFAAVPSLPFGGRKSSGFGRIHGEQGLKEFSYTKSVIAKRFSLPVPLTSFRRPKRAMSWVASLSRIIHNN